MIQPDNQYKEQYENAKSWQEKAALMYIFHTVTAMTSKHWHIKDTASHFNVSIGLVSENLRLCVEIDLGNKLVLESKTREEALKLIERRKYARDRKDPLHKSE